MFMSNNDKRHEFLMKLYEESHTLARENATKRDQIINIYLILLGAYFAFIFSPDSGILQVIFAVCMMLIGGFCVLITITYRKGIISYTGTYEAVGKLILSVDNEKTLSAEEIGDFILANSSKKREGIKALIKGSGNKVIMMFIVLTSLPLWAFYYPLSGYCGPSPFIPIALAIIMCIYIFSWIHYLKIAVDDARAQNEPNSLIRFNDIIGIAECKGYTAKRMGKTGLDK